LTFLSFKGAVSKRCISMNHTLSLMSLDFNGIVHWN